MFKNIKVSVKLIGGFGIVVLLFAGVMGVYQYASNSTIASFENLMAEEVAIGDHATQIGVFMLQLFMLQSRRNEKDFLMRLDKKYADNLNKNVSHLKTEAQATAELADRSGDQESATKASAIIGYADEYEAAFKNLVASWETRGLDHKSGLQGRFRNIAHGVAQDLKGHQVDELQVALLQMRRYEKDFMRTKSDKYKQKFLTNMETYGRLLAQSTSEETAKKAQEKALASYTKAFNDYLAAGESADLQDQSYQNMRSAAHVIGETIGQTLVPNAKALLLDIRKNEKDYLLRNDEKYVKKTHESIENLLQAFKNSGVLQTDINDYRLGNSGR
jgi:methyl-accepting chemotaxis protein